MPEQLPEQSSYVAKPLVARSPSGGGGIAGPGLVAGWGDAERRLGVWARLVVVVVVVAGWVAVVATFAGIELLLCDEPPQPTRATTRATIVTFLGITSP